ncbi:MAG: response regulator transcription factor [Deltaproteobacteria bacterium]|nr:response regulator transcription factor [Deltaproteobacteria bacterium]MBW1870659.1 response regulator transcription factor [Deltaproteobacteria bacterium]
MAIQVVLVYKPNSTLDNLRSIVDAERDMEVVADAGDGRSAVHLAIEMKPEIVVMGLLLPRLNTFEATRRITNEHNGTRVVIIGKYTDKFIIDQVLEVGASNYILLENACKELPKAIRTALHGSDYVCHDPDE